MKTYLGDGVYARFDGFAVWLTTENGIDTTNQICLEPAVLSALFAFAQKLNKPEPEFGQQGTGTDATDT